MAIAPDSRLRIHGRAFAVRKTVDKLAAIVMGAFAVLTVTVLALILSHVVAKGASYISWDFLTSMPAPAGEEGGGVAHAIVGSFIIVGVATLIAVPIGVGASIFLSEFPNAFLVRPIRFIAEILTGVPSIVTGLVVFTLVVQPMGHFSGLAGSVAYAFIMIPIIVITGQESLRLVPTTLREASLALGVPRWRMILLIVLPTASRALITGLVLAVARALGETAPLMFTAFGNSFFELDILRPMATLPLVIFRYATGPYEDQHAQAWAAAFILVVMVLIASILTRLAVRNRND